MTTKQTAPQKGILTEEELNAAIKDSGAKFNIQHEGERALKLVLVDGLSAAQAMTITGIHRTKITAEKNACLNAWRLSQAQKHKDLRQH